MNLQKFQGEEIGMTDQWLSWKDTVDPAACNSNPSIYEQFSRGLTLHLCDTNHLKILNCKFS